MLFLAGTAGTFLFFSSIALCANTACGAVHSWVNKLLNVVMTFFIIDFFFLDLILHYCVH